MGGIHTEGSCRPAVRRRAAGLLARPVGATLAQGDDMTTPSDPYERLQVRPAAEREAIRAAYRVLAKKPPDARGTTEAMAALTRPRL
jgi:hypothetical protein